MNILENLKFKKEELNKLIGKRDINKRDILELEKEISILRDNNNNLNDELIELNKKKIEIKEERSSAKKLEDFAVSITSMLLVAFSIACICGASIFVLILFCCGLIPPTLAIFSVDKILKSPDLKNIKREIEEKSETLYLNNEKIDLNNKELQKLNLENINIDFDIENIVSEFIPDNFVKAKKVVGKLLNSKEFREYLVSDSEEIKSSSTQKVKKIDSN